MTNPRPDVRFTIPGIFSNQTVAALAWPWQPIEAHLWYKGQINTSSTSIPRSLPLSPISLILQSTNPSSYPIGWEPFFAFLFPQIVLVCMVVGKEKLEILIETLLLLVYRVVVMHATSTH